MTWRGIALGLVVTASACGGGDTSLDGEWLAQDAATVLVASAESMGDVSAVRFDLRHEGAAVYIDPVDSLSLDGVVGRFKLPDEADARLTVTVNDSLKTALGAVAIGADVWLSNPVTGIFEPLPAGYDIDPRTFFDPDDGWRPLLAGLREPAFIGVEDNRYHIRGTAPAEQLEVVTAGLVRNADVVVDLWIHPVSGLVSRVEFETEADNGASEWVLELTDYGDDFNIVRPEGV